MESLKSAYQTVVAERQKILDEIKQLEKNEIIKQYMKLCEQNRKLTLKQEELTIQLLREKYQSCDHIWITSREDYDRYEGRRYLRRGCIKCGLDYSANDPDSSIFYTESGEVMRQVIRDSRYGHQLMLKTSVDAIDIYCDLQLARAIFSKLKKYHPDCSDEELVHYLRVALEDIRNIQVSDERKENRAKRLSLGSNFHSWDSSSIKRN
ncbi:MAG TPA: hypothetical protein IAB56_03595 [Candidatus Scybalousia intestinigallinarum]|nr:hypothetical protein [Candidatus Scybalousia intestinigallinarum]